MCARPRFGPRWSQTDAIQSPFILIAVQIRFVLLQNRQGKTRLSKWYIPPPAAALGSSVNPELEKVRIEAEVHRLVTARDKKYTNFIEYNNYKLIYRRYAGLFFTIAVDTYDNELSYLETIHLFVELLDSYFSNGKQEVPSISVIVFASDSVSSRSFCNIVSPVCELDIVFSFNKVYSVRSSFCPYSVSCLW